MTDQFKRVDIADPSAMVLRIAGWLFVLDGVSLLWRGAVGGLFLFHELFSLAFLATFVLHTLVGGVVYSYFGYGLARDRPWTLRPLGSIVAMSAIVWGLPRLGGDYFTAGLGVAYLVGRFFLPRISGAGPSPHAEKHGA